MFHHYAKLIRENQVRFAEEIREAEETLESVKAEIRRGNRKQAHALKDSLVKRVSRILEMDRQTAIAWSYLPVADMEYQIMHTDAGIATRLFIDMTFKAVESVARMDAS